MGLLFLGMTAIILAVSRVVPRPTPYLPIRHERAVDLTPWRYGPPFATFLFALLVFVYLLCSPIGLASREGLGTPFLICAGLLVVLALTLMCVSSLRRFNPAILGSVQNDMAEPLGGQREKLP
jgi:SSS family solute:Na+ symporter